MKYFIIVILSTLLLFRSNNSMQANGYDSPSDYMGKDASYESHNLKLYEQLDGTIKPNFEVFQKAANGYMLLKEQGKIKNEILNVIDFSLHSSQKRLWVIDMVSKKILYHTLVAHGKNTGMATAQKFSNTPYSLQSSLGFYLTAEIYQGKHGTSLNLDGLEKDFNSNARKRRIVIHGAQYASPAFVKKHGRLGRSFGCPAVPMELHEQIINQIADGSCLFIYYPDKNYEAKSSFLKDVPLIRL
ncbi:MAG: murein L,D-transpeptidase catalytic domain family protein [Candidatus Cyclobacteriaceae bacterium M3_2C_046]